MLNGDKKITIVDLANVQKHLLGKITLKGNNFTGADTMLGEEGWIKVYNDETNQLIKETFHSFLISRCLVVV